MISIMIYTYASGTAVSKSVRHDLGFVADGTENDEEMNEYNKTR